MVVSRIMWRSRRIIAATVLLSLCTVLGGCSSGFGDWDPSDLMDWLDTKKKLPGQRKPVFPDGVPGLEQGVPRSMYKDEVEQREREQAAQQQAADAAAAADAEKAKQAAQAPPPEAPKPKKKKPVHHVRKPPVASRQPAPQQAAPAQQQPAQQTPQSAFPAPLPSGSFSR